MVLFTVIDWGKCLSVLSMLIKMIRAKLVFVLVALGVMSGLGLCLSGCKRSEEKPSLPSNSPEVYMKDPVFREALAAKAKELRAIEKEREPLVARMKELFQKNNQSLSNLQHVAEWTNLHARVVDLNARYMTVRTNQLKLVSQKLKGSEIPRPKPASKPSDKWSKKISK